MIDQPIYAKMHELSEAFYGIGWSVSRCEKFSEDMLNRAILEDRKAEQDRLDVAAAKAIPRGVAVVVGIQGCHRVTGYRRAKRGQKLLREAEAAAT